MVEETRRLGRGLAALIGASLEDADVKNSGSAKYRQIPIEFIKRNPYNPRKTFNEEELEELAASIKEKGVLQPIVARALDNSADCYEIIAGERRWRAAQKANLHEMPVIVVVATDKEALEYAIIENVQRADLNAIEEAIGYENLVQEHSYKQADLAKIIGKSRSHIANTLRLLKLPERAKTLIGEGKISAGHARALLSVEKPDEVTDRILNENLSVREVEQIAQQEAVSAGSSNKKEKKSNDRDPNITALEKRLSDVLGLSVNIKLKEEKGVISIQFSKLEQLDSICERIESYNP